VPFSFFFFFFFYFKGDNKTSALSEHDMGIGLAL